MEGEGGSGRKRNKRKKQGVEMHTALLENGCLKKKKNNQYYYINNIDIKCYAGQSVKKQPVHASLGQKYRSTPAVAHAWRGNFFTFSMAECVCECVCVCVCVHMCLCASLAPREEECTEAKE